jgi:hypothetical protein
MVVIHDNIQSLHFINDSGDLIVGIGDHLYRMSYLTCKFFEMKEFLTFDFLVQIYRKQLYLKQCQCNLIQQYQK